MPVFSDGQTISAALAWDRMIDSVPASYVVWKDGSIYRAECLLKGGTDYSGTDATTVIENCMNALTSGRTWKEKIVVKGDFTLTDTLDIPSYTILDIQGRLLWDANVNAPIIKIDGKTDVDIINGVLDGNKDNQTATGDELGIELVNNPQRITIDNVEIKNTKGDGIYCNTGAYINIENCYIHDTQRRGIHVLAEKVKINNCVFLNCGNEASRDGIQLAGGNAKHCLISDTLIVDPYTNGIDIHDATNGSPSDVSISNVSILCPTRGGYGIEIKGGDHLKFSNIHIDGAACTGHGIYIHEGSFGGVPKNISFSNCVVRNVNGATSIHGLYINGSNIEDIKVVNCTFSDNAKHGIDIENSKNILIENNIIYNNKQKAVTGYGIYVGANASNISILTNRIYTKHTTSIYIDATDARIMVCHNNVSEGITFTAGASDIKSDNIT